MPGKANAAHKRYVVPTPLVQRQAASGAAADAGTDSTATGAAFAAAVRPDLCKPVEPPEDVTTAAPVQRQDASDTHPGAYESLGRESAAGLDDAAIQAGMLGASRELSGLDPASPDYDAQRHNLAVLQWEAAQRGLGEDGILPATHGRRGPGGVVLFDDAVHCRLVLEQQTAASGMDGARAFVQRFRAMIGDEPRPAGPAEITEHDGAILLALEQQLRVLEIENARFEVEFERQALTIAYQILGESERRVRAEMARYGMDVDRAWGLAGARASGVAETQDMQAAAQTLLDSQRQLEVLQTKRAAMLWQAHQPGSGDDLNAALDDDLDADVDGMGGGIVTPDEFAALAALDAQIEAAQLEHAQLRTVVEAEHPALARYTSEDQLERVTQDRYGPMQVAWDLDGNLVNIEKTRAALGHDLSVLRLPQVVEIAGRQMMVRPGSMRDRLIAERVEAAEPGMFEDIAIAVVSIGLGLLAAIPTGGGSLAAAGTVAAATTAGVALDAYLVYDAVCDYRIDQAAAGTDPDKARALSQADPSLFWLAVEIIGAGLGGAAAVKTFRGLARARRAALAATGADELAEHLDEIGLLTEGSGLSDDVGERLTRQVVDEHPIPDLAARTREAARKIADRAKRWPDKPGDPAYAKFGPATASHPDELAEVIDGVQKMGARVVERPGALAYQPASTAGTPGTLYLDPDASMSAVLHEVQHLMDDMARGFPGAEVLYQPHVRWAMERGAYAKEISLARRAGDDELIGQLEQARLVEWQRIFMPQLFERVSP